jgi:hypothetical protein
MVSLNIGFAGVFMQSALQPGDILQFSVAAAGALSAYNLLGAAVVAALYRRWAPRMAPSPCMWRCLYTAFVLRGVGQIAFGFVGSFAADIFTGLSVLLPAAAFLCSSAMPSLASSSSSSTMAGGCRMAASSPARGIPSSELQSCAL